MAPNDEPDKGKQGAASSGSTPSPDLQAPEPSPNALDPVTPDPMPVTPEPAPVSSLSPALAEALGTSRAKDVQRDVRSDEPQANAPRVVGGLDDSYEQALAISAEREARTINLDQEG